MILPKSPDSSNGREFHFKKKKEFQVCSVQNKPFMTWGCGVQAIESPFFYFRETHLVERERYKCLLQM